MPTPPTFTKVNPADQPILYLAITSTTMPAWQLDEYAETRIAQRISMISGVAQVQVLGSEKYAVHVQVDPHALAARQIGINEIETALKNWNVNVPTGSIVGPHRAFTLQATGQLMKADEYKSLVVAYRNGAAIRLEQLGNVVDGVEDARTGAWLYTKDAKQRAITLGIQRQPGTNTIEVADAVKELLKTFRAELPQSVHMDVLYDRSDTIRDSYRDVQFTMVLTLALVIFVIFVFLRNVWATVIPSLALPFSIIGTFSVMYMLGYSLDNLSMMALILSVGFVVDDAIVMLENIYRHVEMGKDPLTASLVGSREIGFTIVSMTLSLAAVFIPVLFISGVLGRLFREFSVTICVAILISGVVSVTLTPMLCSRFLRRPASHGGNRFARASEAGFQWLLERYDRTLQIVLRHRRATMVAFFVVLFATAYLFMTIPKGFIPDQDTDQIAVTTEAAQGTSYDRLVVYQDAVAQILRKDPNVDALVSTVGGTASQTLGGPNLGQIVVHLKPRSERKELANQIIERLRPELESVVGMRVYAQNPPTIRIGGEVSKSLYQYSMQSPNRQVLYDTATRLTAELQKEPLLSDVTSDLAVTSPQINIQIDRDKAAALGVTANAIESAFYDAYGTKWVSTIYGTVNEYKVLLELDPKYQADPSALSLLYFKATPSAPPAPSSGSPSSTASTSSQSGQSGGSTAPKAPPTGGIVVPLDTLAKATQVVGPQSITHYGQLPSVTVSFGLAPGAALGSALTRVKSVADNLLPETVSGQFQGARGGVPELAGQPCDPARDRDHGRLHRAGDPLRELHPPDDDSLGPAVGRLRRARHAAALPHRPEHLRLRRHDHADRHRRKERDHADRLRARGRAQRHVAWRGDLQRLPDPFPSDHDDDHGSVIRCGADRAGLRRGRRSAPAAWSRRRRRPHLLAARHAVPDARCLHLPGTGPGLAEGRLAHTGAGGRHGQIASDADV